MDISWSLKEKKREGKQFYTLLRDILKEREIKKGKMGGKEYKSGERWTEKNKKKIKNKSIYLTERERETRQRREKEREREKREEVNV